MGVSLNLKIPEGFEFLLEPCRYKCLYGGRGGAKSHTVARALLYLASIKKIRVLCARELQLSISDSVHQLLKALIEGMGLIDCFDVTDKAIRSTRGSEFIFSGIRMNTTKVMSMEGIDICWVEEAQSISESSWEILIPTIRKPGSEIWVTFNPDQESDPTYKRFVTTPPPNSKIVKVGWEDNPWLSDELRAEKDYLYRVDPEAAAHVWGGDTRRRSDAQILNGKWVVEPFEPQKHWDGPYYGVDWGFSSDPTVMIRCWVSREPNMPGEKLWIDHEAWGLRVDNDALPELFASVPGSRTHASRADNARPETISHMNSRGFPQMTAAEKWPGSVEDGISHLRGYEQIMIHPRCKHTQEEARLYSYKTDRLTGDVMPDIIDKNNHCWDGVRYALAPRIRRREVLIDPHMPDLDRSNPWHI